MDHSCKYVSYLPPLVSKDEIETLRNQVAYAVNGEAFLIQGGDSMESFAKVQVDNVNAKQSSLSEEPSILERVLRVPINKLAASPESI